MKIQKEIWIGLIGLYPLWGNEILNPNEGAYTNILIPADNKEDYLDQLHSFLSMLHFEAFEWEDIELLNNRKENHQIDPEVLELEQLSFNSQEPQICTLYIFERDDFLYLN